MEADATLVEATHSAHKSTPIMFAAQKGHAEVVRYLIGKKANVNAKGGPSSNTTMLDFAMQAASVECALLVVKAGAIVSASNLAAAKTKGWDLVGNSPCDLAEAGNLKSLQH